MRHDRPTTANLTVDQLQDRIRRALRVRHRPGAGLSFRSGRSIYFFSRIGQTSQLTVKVRPARDFEQPVVEALAARLQRTRVCPTCKATFERNGRQAYCTALCSARARKARWRAAQ